VIAPDDLAPKAELLTESLAAACGTCQCCGLAATRQQVVVGRGNPNARLLLVGEAPGAEEEACGQPFVGRSGRLLEAMLAAAGLSSERDLYIANVIKCRPPGNRKPSRAEIEACRPWLERQIALVRPQLVLLVGATALEALLGIRGGITKLRGQWFHLEASQGPDQPAPSEPPPPQRTPSPSAQGQPMPSPSAQSQRSPSQPTQRQRMPSPRSPIRWPQGGAGGIALMPLLHPSYLLRNPSEAEGSPRWLTRADLVAVRDRLGE
jgi:DNA polymerase